MSDTPPHPAQNPHPTPPDPGAGSGVDDFRHRLLEAVDQALIATDLDGTIVYWNDAAERLYGWAADEVLGRQIVDVTPAPEMAERAAEIMAALGRGERWSGEFLTRHKDGSPIPVLVTDTPITDAGGRLIGIAGVSTDLRERKRMEAALREETRIVETLHSIGTALTAELDLQKVVQTVTDAATSMTGAEFGAFFYNVLAEAGESYTLYTISGVPREEFSKFPMPRNTPIFGPTFRGEGIVRSDDITKDPRYGKVPPHHGMPEGHLPVTSYLAVPVISRNGEVIGGLFFGHHAPGRFQERHERLAAGIAAWAAVAMDNARLYEAEHRARAGAEAANRTKSDFLAVMSHELRTPLGAILGYTDILNLEMAGPLTEEQRAHLRRIKASARHLLYLIDEVLIYARMEAGKETVRPEEVELSAVVDEVVAMIEPLAEEHRLEFQANLPPAPVGLRTDPGKLRQVLVNLLTNAVKFTPHGSVMLDVLLEGDEIAFLVRDTGIGIPAEHLEQIFEAFWQVDQGITRTVGGTGLGLSVVRRLAHMLGGEVSAESGVGVGSTFTVRLPTTMPDPA